MPKERAVMTIGALKGLLREFKIQDDFEIWLSSDAEGNEILPMQADPQWSLAIEQDAKRITLYSSHR